MLTGKSCASGGHVNLLALAGPHKLLFGHVTVGVRVHSGKNLREKITIEKMNWVAIYKMSDEFSEPKKGVIENVLQINI